MKKIQDLRGKKFGMLTVIDVKREKNKTYYLCECECGSNNKWIRADSIKSGNIKSCGCYRNNVLYKREDLTGKNFDRLTVVKLLDKRANNGERLFECICSCGNKCNVRASSLIYNITKSCGCLHKEQSSLNTKKGVEKFKENIVDGTNVASLMRSKTIKSNTSGTTGVFWDSNNEKWAAAIYFKNKRIRLGEYTKKEDAIKARKEAEENIHKKFLREKGFIE